MKKSKIMIEGEGGESACLIFSYENFPFLGETSLSGDPFIVDILRKNLSLPQAISRRGMYPAPLSKGYLHAFAAARVTANTLGLNLHVIDEPFYPSPEELERYAETLADEVEADVYSDEQVAELLNFEFIITSR